MTNIYSQPVTYNSILLTTEHFLWSGNTPGTRHRKYKCNIWHWFGQIRAALVLVQVASTLALRTRSKLNRCETTSLRWFSLIRIKSLIQIKCCSVNARMGVKPVSLRIKSASVNGVLQSAASLHISAIPFHLAALRWAAFPLAASFEALSV